ncbi:hypothetical protein BHE74_00010993 [Ensete ventricosum]|nr:hypothetical protein BHE74_00010993 [Ensete ventricosum]
MVVATAASATIGHHRRHRCRRLARVPASTAYTVFHPSGGGTRWLVVKTTEEPSNGQNTNLETPDGDRSINLISECMCRLPRVIRSGGRKDAVRLSLDIVQSIMNPKDAVRLSAVCEGWRAVAWPFNPLARRGEP